MIFYCLLQVTYHLKTFPHLLKSFKAHIFLYSQTMADRATFSRSIRPWPGNSRMCDAIAKKRTGNAGTRGRRQWASAYDTDTPKKPWTRLHPADKISAWKEASFSKRVHPRGNSYQPRESKGGYPTWQQGGRMRVGIARCVSAKLSNGISKP